MLSSMRLSAQCEELEGNGVDMILWKEKYSELVDFNSKDQFISADSVLIYYLSNKSNQTNYGMSCSFYQAVKFAETELINTLDLLYSKLEEADAVNLKLAQSRWQIYYDSEAEFQKQAIVGYANSSKYNLGREASIDLQAMKYQIVKDRILQVKSYIDLIGAD